MQSTIKITPTSNVDSKKCLINQNDIEDLTFDSHSAVLKFFNVKDKELRKDFLINVSLYDDRLVICGRQFHILTMFSI